jgi:hypothetical protein
VLKRLLIGFAVLLGLFVVLLAVPVTHTAERSRLIAAQPASIQAQLDSPRDLDTWLPRHHTHAGSATFEGPARGAGALLRWQTVKGEDHALRVAGSSPERVTFEMQPNNAAVQTVSLRLEGGGTRVTWSHAVTLRGWQKLVPLLRSVDSVVGPDLEKALAALAARVEGKGADAVQPPAP